MARRCEDAKNTCAATGFIDARRANILSIDYTPACTFTIFGHTLGGAYADRAPEETAYYHRDSLMLLCGSTGIPSILMSKVTLDEIKGAYERTDGFLK
jgi:hypothetical protein